jgi:hypothetical protein
MIRPMIRGRKARALVTAVLPQVQPYLSERVRIEVVAHRRWLTIRHAHDRMGAVGPELLRANDQDFPKGRGATFIPGLGAWIPFLPHRLRRRLVAQDVVETLLSIGTPSGREQAEREYNVVARNTPNGVLVAFDRPGSSGERVEIGPISDKLLR